MTTCVCSWWFSIDRREADKQLMLPGNPRGTFLIRNSGGKKLVDETLLYDGLTVAQAF